MSKILKNEGPSKWGKLKKKLEDEEGKELHHQIVSRAIKQARKWNKIEKIDGYYYLPKQKIEAYRLAQEPHPVLNLEALLIREEIGTAKLCMANVKNEGDLRARDCMAYLTLSDDELLAEDQTVWASGADKMDIFPGKAQGVVLLRVPEEMPNQLHIPSRPSTESHEGFEYGVFTIGRELNQDKDYIFTIEVDSLDFPPMKRKIPLNRILKEVNRSPSS